MVKTLKKTYDIIFEDGSGKMKISRGGIHEYFYMILDLSEPGEVKINMIPFIEEIVKDFSKDDGTMRTSALP